MGSVGRHTLSPSQLKSALQKNVRLSRPEEAVRCATAMALCPSSSSTTSASPIEQFIEGLTQLIRRYVATTSNCMIVILQPSTINQSGTEECVRIFDTVTGPEQSHHHYL
jgi:hypothetical protein